MKLIALDMDGTLLDSHKKISAPTREALKKANEAGKYVCLATGRCLAELEDYEDIFPYLSYGILISGGALYDFRNKKYLEGQSLSDEMIQRIAQSVKGRDVMVQLLTQQHSVVQIDKLAHIEDYQMGVYRPLYEKICFRQEDVLSYALSHQEEIFKINIYHRNQADREITYKKLKDLPLSFAYAETTSLEMTPQGVNKGAGLEKLCDDLHLELKDCMAVGDAMNDADILKIAGLSVAMGNAVPEIKDLCDVSTADLDHHGVQEAIEKYLL